MQCVANSVFSRSTWVFSALCVAFSIAACSTETLHPRRTHVVVTRVDEDPACTKLGIVSLSDIRPEELSPSEPMSRPSLEEIHDKASAIGANYVVVVPGQGGPTGKVFYCS